MSQTLTTRNHDRDVAGLKYVYPVISRRAGGLSIGINFNPNNACNWRCIYCQVPNLQLGGAPTMDFELLEEELRFFLQLLTSGEFYQQFTVPPEQRVIKDLAISGNGEPTSLVQFDKAIRMIAEIADQAGLFPAANFVLISNGSLLHRPSTQKGLQVLAEYGGELWFKLDSGSETGRKEINQTRLSQAKLLENIRIASQLCRVKLQTCILHYRQAWSSEEKLAYLALLEGISLLGIPIAQIMLYSIARQSHQPEAAELLAADTAEMEAFAADIRAIGFDVSVSS